MRWTTGGKRADGKAVIDYGFHMIVTELEDAGLGEMDRLVRDEGHHQLQAVHGVSRRLHGGRCDDLPGAAPDRRERRPGVHARRERRRDRRARQGGAAQGRNGAEVSRADAAADGGRRSDRPRDRACGNGARPDLHRPPVGGARAREGEAGARHGAAGLRGDLSAVPLPLLRQLRGAGLRRRQVRHVAAAA